MTTAQRAIKAAKDAEREGYVVREVVIEGKAFRLVFGDTVTGDDYDLRDMRL